MNKGIKKITLLALVMVAVSTIPLVHAVEATPTPTITITPTVTKPPRATNRAETAKEILLGRARTIANKIFETQFLAKLNALRGRVLSNEKIGTDAKTALLAKIDSEIAWFTTQKETLSTATTLDQIKKTVKTARERFFQLSKELRRLYITHGFVVSLEKVIENIEKNILSKIENKLNELTVNGVDISLERALLNQAKSELAAAKISIVEIKNSTTFEAAKKNFDTAKTSVKAARQTLKDLLVSLKAKLE